MPKQTNPELEALVTVVADDEELKARVKAFANKALDHAEYILDNGTALLKTQIIRVVMPALSKSLNDKKAEDEEIVELRQMVNDLMLAMATHKSPSPTDATITPLRALNVDNPPS